MKGMKDNQELAAEIGDDGSIHVESHYVGSLKGFRYIPDTQAEGLEGKADAQRRSSGPLARNVDARAARRRRQERRVHARRATAGSFGAAMTSHSSRRAMIPSSRRSSLIADENLQGADRERVLARCQTWIADTIAERLKPLVDISKAEDIDGLARGIAFRLVENVGVLKRDSRRRGNESARPGGPRPAAPVRRALRRLQHLLSRPC